METEWRPAIISNDCVVCHTDSFSGARSCNIEEAECAKIDQNSGNHSK